MREAFLEPLDGADDVEALARATGAADDADAACAHAHALEDLVTDADFLFGLGRERHADRVADPRPDQAADADRGFDRAADQAARFGNAEVERAIDRACQLVIGGDREEQVARLDRDLVFAKVVILEQPDMVERTFDERLGAGFAVFFEQVAFEAAGVDADADRAAIGLGGVDDFADALVRTDIAGVDAQARGAGVGGFQGALVMEMNVGDDRHARRADDLLQCSGAVLVGARDADDVGARFLAAADLVDRRPGVAGRRVGHRLDADRRIAADGDIADHDLARDAPFDIAPGADGHEISPRLRAR